MRKKISDFFERFLVKLTNSINLNIFEDRALMTRVNIISLATPQTVDKGALMTINFATIFQASQAVHGADDDCIFRARSIL